MAVKSLNPYLNYNGTAAKAIALYEKALGATTTELQRFSDVPGMKVPDDMKSRIMHAVLHIGPGKIMVSDTHSTEPDKAEGDLHVVVDYDDVADMEKKFNALSEGGKVTQPLQDMFWGARFGTLTDAYGVKWMFNCALKK